MSVHALDAIEDALSATGRYRPSEPLEWLWIVLVAGTVASPGFGLPTGGRSSGEMSPEGRAALEEFLPSTLPDLLLVGAVIVGLLWLLFVLIRSFLEFPFLRWLRGGDLAIREEVRGNWRAALGLAGFRLLLNLLGLSVLAGGTVAIAGTDADPWTYLFVLVEYWVLFALLGLATGIIAAFTTAFVVPTMWLQDRTVVDGWRRLWPTLRDEATQFLAYAVGVAVLATLGGVLVGVAAAVALAPALVVSLGVAIVAGGAAAVVVGALLGGISAAVAVGLVYAFVQVFLRYYALFVLGDVDANLDAIPERRRAVRADGGDQEGRGRGMGSGSNADGGRVGPDGRGSGTNDTAGNGGTDGDGGSVFDDGGGDYDRGNNPDRGGSDQVDGGNGHGDGGNDRGNGGNNRGNGGNDRGNEDEDDDEEGGGRVVKER